MLLETSAKSGKNVFNNKIGHFGHSYDFGHEGTLHHQSRGNTIQQGVHDNSLEMTISIQKQTSPSEKDSSELIALLPDRQRMELLDDSRLSL